MMFCVSFSITVRLVALARTHRVSATTMGITKKRSLSLLLLVLSLLSLLIAHAATLQRSSSSSSKSSCSLFISTTATATARNPNRNRNILLQQRPQQQPSTFAFSSLLTAKMTRDNINSNDSPLPPRPPPSFYQRKLPESTCVGFASAKGKKIFQSALQHDGLKSFYHLIQQYHTQTEPAFCGVSTLVMVLNTLSVDPHQHWKGPWRWYEEKMLNCCIDLETIKKTGITLRDFQCLALCQGLSVDLEYVYDDDDDEEDNDDENVDDDASDPTTSPDTSDPPSSGLERFRRAVRNTCVEEPSRETDTDIVDDNNGNDNGSDQNKDDDDDDDGPLSVLVVSYNRRTLKQTGTGHFSPIAAYDAVSDSVLILDTARFKYGAHWVKLPLIYDAMKSIDPDSNKPRGYALLSFLPSPPLEIEPGEKASHTELMKTNTETNRRMSLSSDGQLQPMSIMFRMKMNQNEKRRKFKRFLQSLSPRDPSTKKSDNEVDDNNSDHHHILLEQISSYLSGHRHQEDNNKQHKKKEEDPCIWAIVEPMRVTDDVGKSMVAQMRTLLRDLRNNSKFVNQNGCGGRVREDDDDKDPQHSNNKESSSTCCDQSQFQMNYFVSSDEAVFVVYLAALSENERRDMVMNVESEVSDLIRQQLLMEADMIDSAIEMSDELTSFESP